MFVETLLLGYTLINMTGTDAQGAEAAPASPELLAAGTMAPDGVGVTVRPSANPGMTEFGPWIGVSTTHPLNAGGSA